MSSRDDERPDPDALLAEISAAAPPPEPPRGGERSELASYAWAAAAIAVITAIGLAVFPYVAIAEITMLYLIAIMLASLLGRGPSLVAASFAVVAFNFCFIPPRFTFAVADVGHLITFAVM